ncbi:phosphotransferase [Marilutibacter chinensis]|uniref:Phosphotransferase n=1 Tax=Marilutibacter chinensis TaxID=2912247 RepID=A0ABS9HRZ2_9GAMM|nr:phosphotransferase [Lysobacter chinensis]MCF7221695.1 phosphotransferase [Lysobacter chinensis]
MSVRADSAGVALDRAGILARVPHQGAMCLWDAVLDWDAQRIRLQADSHRDAGHPLRHRGRLASVHLCEYGAQAMAVHGGLLAHGDGRRPRAGLLVALRAVELEVARIDDLAEPLIGEAVRIADTAAGQLYAFRIEHAGGTIAQGRALVALAGAAG